MFKRWFRKKQKAVTPMSSSDTAAAATSGDVPLCVECGLCCQGTMFGMVRLREADDIEEVRATGLQIEENDGFYEFPLPCPLQEGTCCTIYEKRPFVCGAFECQLLVSQKLGYVTREEAGRTVAEGKELIGTVRRMLWDRGERTLEWPLVSRYLYYLQEGAKAGGEEAFHEANRDLTEAMERWIAFKNEHFWDDSNEVEEGSPELRSGTGSQTDPERGCVR